MSEYILELNHISKSYSGNQVLRDVSIRVKPGEVVSIVGENGAGKSTLMNILFGMNVIAHTGGFEGSISFEGREVSIRSSEDALKLGIGMVHQEFMLIDNYSVAENVKLNRENTRRGPLSRISGGKLDVLDRAAMARETRQALKKVDLDVDEWAQVAGLPIGTLQFIEIAKVLDSSNTKVLIFDEPTAVLTEQESEKLLESMLGLARRGVACVFISHKLEEVLRVSDSIYVLRDGERVGLYGRGEVNAAELAKLMVNRDVVIARNEKRDFSGAPTVMRIRDLEVNMPGEPVRGVSLDIYEGEILGIAGLAGSGKLGISNGVRGLYKAAGSVEYRGRKLPLGDVAAVAQEKMAFVSEDRKKVGLVLDETIEMNCVLPSAINKGRFLKRVAGIRFIDRQATRKAVDEMIRQLDIRCTGKEQRVGALSGGNQQKVCMAAMLLQQPEMLFVSEPSRGIDIGAKQRIIDHLRQINRRDGATIVVTSSELNELRSLCDRIVVIYDGKIAGTLPADAPSEAFGELIVGQKMMGQEAIKG